MESLIHNQTFRIAEGPLKGIYRVVFNDKLAGVVVAARIDTRLDKVPPDSDVQDRGAPLKSNSSVPLSGKLQWLEYSALEDLRAKRYLTEIEIARENFKDSNTDQALFELRKRVMTKFWQYDSLIKVIRETGSIGELVKDAQRTYGVSRGLVYKCWSLLCRFGFSVDSLRTRMDRCGGPGQVRNCDEGGRRKNGRKTDAERVAQQTGEPPPPTQPGMTEEWRELILMSDSKIPAPKPRFTERFDQILVHFRRHFVDDDKTQTPTPLKKNEYPNEAQVRRVLNIEIPRLEQVRQRTTKGHFESPRV